jgi:hypothetical protein
MPWSSRAKRFGGATIIAEKRQRQTVMLLRAGRIQTVADEAKETLKWLQENNNRCLTVAEEERWKEFDS